MERYWFKAKRYGWGWYPGTWQGWLVLGGYLIVTIGITFWWASGDEATVERTFPLFLFSIALIIGTMIYVCYKTGEPPRWRWGDDNKV